LTHIQSLGRQKIPTLCQKAVQFSQDVFALCQKALELCQNVVATSQRAVDFFQRAPAFSQRAAAFFPDVKETVQTHKILESEGFGSCQRALAFVRTHWITVRTHLNSCFYIQKLSLIVV